MSGPSSPPNDATWPAGDARGGQFVDRVRSLYAHATSSLVGNALGAAIVAGLGLTHAERAQVLAWLAAFAALWMLRLGLALAHRRAAPADELGARHWLQRWALAALASGALWGVAGWSFQGLGPGWHDTALLLVIAGLCVGSIPSLATQGSVYLGFIALALLPTTLRIALGGTASDLALAGVLMLILATAALLGRNYRRAFEELLRLKARTEALGDELRAQTALAEQAKRDAEAANRAKTRFFAAASHDLRQPLHAIGLFVQALQATTHESAMQRIIERIDRSVVALDALFTELLDLTRLEAGGVEVRREAFALEPVLERLRLHFEPVAFEKGLALRFRGGHHVAYADPMLVERILRNLTANALRYTDDGGVLVAVRRRADTLVLQVWDSGIGIAAADQARIFDEFVRLGGGGDGREAAADVERRKGLGMGLAIVRRLAALLDAPLELRSTPGRGSVFSLRVPCAARS